MSALAWAWDRAVTSVYWVLVVATAALVYLVTVMQLAHHVLALLGVGA